MKLQFKPISTELARAMRSGAPDAYGAPAERAIAPDTGAPCRHCLGFIPKGAPMLIFALRPFSGLHPYAETGPVFLCADDCTAFDPDRGVPEIFAQNDMLIRAYDENERILYGTGQVVPPDRLAGECAARLARADVAFVHVRSSTNNCYQARVARA